MMKVYYQIMVSSIYTAQNNGVMSDIWKFASNFYMAFATSVYLILCYIFLNYCFFAGELDLIWNFIPSEEYNFILNVFLYFTLPVMVINHLAVYQNSKYEELIKEYESAYNKKIFALYFIMSFLFIFTYVFSNVEFRYK